MATHDGAAPLPPAANDSSTAPEVHGFRFTGSGKEYFRIWIVNLFLTVATLGIYSAWAKVRRLQYFDRNTELAGAVFDFRGDPRAILKGRLLGVLLLAAYHYAFGFSLAIGLAVVAGLLLALPFFLRSALRFRLHNTQYRGLHFDFSGSTGGAYRAYLPPLLTFLLPGALVAIDPGGKWALYAFLLYLGWPLMYGAMKRYQHQHLQFGAIGSRYEVPARRFFKPYLLAVLVGLAVLTSLFVLFFFGGIVVAMVAKASGTSAPGGALVTWLPIAIGALSAYATYLLAGPYLQTRIANLAWSNTAFPGVEIRSTMAAGAFIRLQSVNALLTVVTLGLYRPFAVVRVYEYRLAHLALHSASSFESIAAAAARRRGGAAGDGMADFLGVDLSW
ncbi:MAG: YjgN family protein [Pseudomonadota bacterium]|nr:YjgN family protein [Pseudomonadota bacterium]